MPDPATPSSAASRLILVGYRGTGKTVTSALLAERLGWQAIDTDFQLVQDVGQPISAIFADRGEAVFRQLECDTLRKLVHRKQVVIATGGGIVLSSANRELIDGAGPVVWLRASVSTIQSRLAKDRSVKETRPALLGKDAVTEVPEVLRQRAPLYEAVSDFVLDTDSLTPAQVADAILAWLRVDCGGS